MNSKKICSNKNNALEMNSNQLSEEYYRDINHWDVYIEPFVFKERNWSERNHAFYFYGHYAIAIPKNSNFMKPDVFYDLTYYCCKMPDGSVGKKGAVALRKVVLPYSTRFDAYVSTDCIMNEYVLFEFNRNKKSIVNDIANKISLDYRIGGGGFESFGRGCCNCNDIYPYLEEHFVDEKSIALCINENNICEKYLSNIFILKLNSLSTMIVLSEGRSTWGCNLCSGSVSYSMLNQNSFVVYPNTLYQIEGDSAIALDIGCQLNNPNDELHYLFPRGIKVNDILTSNKSKVLSYFKKDSFLYRYFESRDDNFPALTIEDEIWRRGEDYGSHFFYHPDYWTNKNSGFEYFDDEFADPSTERQMLIIKALKEKDGLDKNIDELLGEDRKRMIADIM